MTYQMASDLTGWFIKKGFLQQKDYNVYVYCIDSLLAKLLFYTAILVVAVALHIVPQTVIFFISFITFRSTAGGYHAESDKTCSILSWAVYIICMLLVTCFKALPAGWTGSAAMLLNMFAVVTAFRYAPIDHFHKPVSAERKTKMRICCLYFQMAWTLLCLMLLWLKLPVYAFSLALGNGIAAAFLLFAYYQKKGGEPRMKHVFTRFCNGFLALALFIGTLDVSMVSRDYFYQPPVPEELLHRVN